MLQKIPPKLTITAILNRLYLQHYSVPV